MIKEIFTVLHETLSEIKDKNNEPLFRHIDLWNQNTAYLREDNPFSLPAAFIEFEPIPWEDKANGTQETSIVFKIHCVSSWEGSTSGLSPNSLSYLDNTDIVFDHLHKYKNPLFGELRRVQSNINHNHEEIIDSIETYTTLSISIQKTV